jgi:DNA-binding response OmpR family regulator
MAVSILSVSYDPNLLFTRQLILEQAGYQVTSALGFTKALAYCKNSSFNLLILGHSIPHSDKCALVESFRASCSAPIVLLLRPGEPHVDGVQHYLSPDNPRMLLEEIAAIVGESRQRARA